ncbi:helix-turn-helix transcriptional regulator [Longitalea luteola]|uniref:helix-turn-helix transcriptional regulator n=1 Tax=Longitalea luteola TaxID=2812563 RepID=UPI001A95C61A|nr:AraC family transcriptional regulator [Longitalea luteola]
MTDDRKRANRHVLQAVYAFKGLLDDHCCNGDSAVQLSAQFGVSRNVLQRNFKTNYGVGIRDYKMKQRMERARQLLESGKDVKEVSMLLNYSQQRAFSAAFKNYYGVTPTVFAHTLPGV